MAFKASANDDVNPLWRKVDYRGKPWVSNVSRVTDITRGLSGRHISLWASHGRFYNNDRKRWEWQRPNLFGTTEDLFTQTIVVPYLIPMLENAGAVVFTPRERDWQSLEYIVDREGGLDTPSSCYLEYPTEGIWKSTDLPGFAAHKGVCHDNENPFRSGTARMAIASKKDSKAFVTWKPYFARKGKYAVYVSYQTLDKSVDDAHYTVFHQGIATEFRVNQKIGGGTWVYLGTFTFDEGASVDNCVILTNQSKRKGVVTADAVRFGGGVGNIERGGSTSGYPRAIEGARYYAQWAGMPYNVYSCRMGTDDYSDDINVRSLMTNWLSGGSAFNPVHEGLGVPIELSLAIHSDAGYANDGKTPWGSLAVCTTDFNDGRLASGITRQASKQFASLLLDNVTKDLTHKYYNWPKRYLWDRNYSETRLPAVPSAILETLSHQSFPDMLLGHDPNFRFDMARSIYKTIVKYVNGMHGEPVVIEPLAPQGVSAELKNGKAILNWTPQTDLQEKSAEPDAYIVYTAIGNGGFDNGVKIKSTTASFSIKPGVPYHYKVTAINRGGESFPSETVSVLYEPNAIHTVLIVNGFHRLSAPSVINNATCQGFDLDDDIGVSNGVTAGWNGKQINFERSGMGKSGKNALGHSGNELAGKFIAGNDFNYVASHVEAIATAHKYNVASCSSKAVENGKIKLAQYAAMDLILGLERFNPYSVKYYKTFTPALQRHIADFLQRGGRLMASGAYTGSDMYEVNEKEWLRQMLNVTCIGQLKTDTISGATGMGIENFDFHRLFNPEHYAVQKADKLQPVGNAFCAMKYSDGSTAAVGYDGEDKKTFTMGFPFECITDAITRGNIMRGILAFLLPN